MAGNGPPPSPNARRRNARPAFRRLPATGRPGVPPAWPLGGRATKNELALWEQLWATPQATAWEELGWVRTVARYARITVAAERPRAIAAVMSEARQLEDRLGLNPKAMRSLGWEISADAAQETDGDADVLDIDAFRARVGS
jgi:hypothetical protein